MARGAFGTFPGPGPDPHARWRPAFAVAITAFICSLVVFLALVVTAACGTETAARPTEGAPSETQSADGGPTGTEGAAGSSPTSGDTATSGTTTEPTPTSQDGSVSGAGAPGRSGNDAGGPQQDGMQDNTPLVACNQLLVPVDKQHRLAPDCEPDGLLELPARITNGNQYMTGDAAAAMIRMIDAATAEGLSLFVVSSYRSYENQVQLYQYWVDTLGEEEAARSSARPGHSEHQLGTTADLSTQAVGYEPNDAFAQTPEGAWVGENAWKFGFIVSYPAGKEPITGYEYEPWHVRFVGIDTARQVFQGGKTLHEFLLQR